MLFVLHIYGGKFYLQVLNSSFLFGNLNLECFSNFVIFLQGLIEAILILFIDLFEFIDIRNKDGNFILIIWCQTLHICVDKPSNLYLKCLKIFKVIPFEGFHSRAKALIPISQRINFSSQRFFNIRIFLIDSSYLWTFAIKKVLQHIHFTFEFIDICFIHVENIFKFLLTDIFQLSLFTGQLIRMVDLCCRKIW